MKSNIHKKLYQEDKFARHYYCKHARLNQIRQDKKAEKKAWRRFLRLEEEREVEDGKID